MLVLRTSNFQGATIRGIVSRNKHSILSLLFTTKFSTARQLKNHIYSYQLLVPYIATVIISSRQMYL